jgi:hypothetical protein
MASLRYRCLTLFGCLLAVSLVAGSASASAAVTQTEIDQTIAGGAAWLRSKQVQSGAIGGFNGDWATTTLAAGGVNAADVRESGALGSLQDYWQLEYAEPELAQLPSPVGPGQLGKAILIAHSAGLQPTRISADVNLAATLASTYDWSDGSFGGTEATNALGFALLAMPRVGFPITIADRVTQGVLASQHPDGGWTFEGPGTSPGDTDMTGAALAMVCSNGVGSGDPRVQTGLDFLHAQLDPATGAIESSLPFAPLQNAPTQAWALIGIEACGENPQGSDWTTAQGKNPIDFALSLRVTSGAQAGAIRYEPGSTATDPNNVNATEALVRALSGHLFSADPPPREDPSQPAVRPAPTVAGGTLVPIALTIDDGATPTRVCAVRVLSGAPLAQVLAAAQVSSVPAGCVTGLASDGPWVTALDGVGPGAPTGGWVASTPGSAEQRAGSVPVRFGDVVRLRFDPDLPPLPPSTVAPPSLPLARPAIAGRKGPRHLGRRRVATLATLRCPAGGACQILAPRRVPLELGARSYPIRVLAPRWLAADAAAPLRVRLSRSAATALAARGGGIVTVTVRVAGPGGLTARTVSAALRSNG